MGQEHLQSASRVIELLKIALGIYEELNDEERNKVDEFIDGSVLSQEGDG